MLVVHSSLLTRNRHFRPGNNKTQKKRKYPNKDTLWKLLLAIIPGNTKGNNSFRQHDVT